MHSNNWINININILHFKAEFILPDGISENLILWCKKNLFSRETLLNLLVSSPSFLRRLCKLYVRVLIRAVTRSPFAVTTLLRLVRQRLIFFHTHTQSLAESKWEESQCALFLFCSKVKGKKRNCSACTS